MVACYILTGDADFMLHLVMVDLEAYSDFVVGRLLTAPAMASINSSIVLRPIKEYTGLPTKHLSTPA